MPSTGPMRKARRQPTREAHDVEEDQAAEGAEDRACPVGAVDHDVDAAPVARRDELVDRGVDRRVLAADTHARDEPREVEVADPEGAVAEGERGEPAADQVHAQGDHEEVAAAELVGEPSEEQRADDLAREVDGGDEPCRGGGQRERLRVGQHVGDGAGDRDLQPVEDPRHAERDHHAGVEPRPREPVDPRRDEAAHHAGCRSGRRHRGGRTPILSWLIVQSGDFQGGTQAQLGGPRDRSAAESLLHGIERAVDGGPAPHVEREGELGAAVVRRGPTARCRAA